jgi:aminopeptidase-like protein
MTDTAINVSNLSSPVDQPNTGHEMYRLIAELFPICRSITGNGVRETLKILKNHIPLTTHNVPTGTQVFDWTVPREWNITDAYVKDSRGERVIDFRRSNLHVMNYSVPIKRRMSLAELRPHLFTLPNYPDWVPYRTSYYNENWGFCLSHNQLMQLRDEEYEVCIDSSLESGFLTYGQCVLPGDSSEEVLISCHVCHPSLANDNLSGITLALFLAKHLSSVRRKYSYRFLFIPGTIGSITWLSQHEAHTSRIKHGLVLASVGAGNKFTYKKSRRGNAEIDRATVNVLRHSDSSYDVIDFSPYGYDERQFCSPGFNLPVGCFMRTPNGQFPEYHTSADNMNFVQSSRLAESFEVALGILSVLENNGVYINPNPKCEPQLGKRGLYRSVGGVEGRVDELAMLWVLNLSDGNQSLLDIAERSGCAFDTIKRAADALLDHALLKPSHANQRLTNFNCLGGSRERDLL